MTPRAVTLAAVALAAALRLAFGLGYWVDKPLTGDEVEYLALAENLANGRGFSYDAPADQADGLTRFARAPLYPLVLAGVYRTYGWPSPPPPTSTPTIIKVLQSFLGAFVVWLIAVTAARVGGPRAGAAAAVLAAVYPPLVWLSGYVFSELLFSALALGAVEVLGRRMDRDEAESPAAIRAVFLAGVLSGLAALTRSAMLFFLLFAGLRLLARRRVTMFAALAIGSILTIAPWTVRNMVRHDRVILVAADGGVTFWTGNHPLSPGEGDMAANPDIKRASLALRAQHPGLSAEALEPIYYREAFRAIASDPVWWIGLLARKAFYLVVPIGPSYTLHSPLYFWTSVASYGLIAPFALWGALALRRSGSAPIALWLLAASAAALCIIFMPQERFRIPVIDPTLIVCAAALARRSDAAAAA